MDLAAVRAGLAANLATLADDVQISAYWLANPSPPTIHIAPSTTVYHQAMVNGLVKWEVTVQGLVGLTTELGSQQRLDEWLATSGTLSVKAAIETDRTLGGVVADANVVSVSLKQLATQDGRVLLGADWLVEVLGT